MIKERKGKQQIALWLLKSIEALKGRRSGHKYTIPHLRSSA